MHQKYTIAFSSNTNLVFVVVLKRAGFSSLFKIILSTFDAHDVIL